MDESFERTLREREELYHTLFEDNHAVMLLVDPATGTIVDANGAAVRFYGYSRERLMLMRMSDLEALPQDEIFDEMRRASAERRSFFRFRHRLGNGEIRDVEVYTAPINVRDRNLLYSLVHDVTERRRAEEALRDAEIRYRTLVEQVPVVTYMDRVVEDDPTDVVPVYISPQVEAVLGYTPEEWIGDPDLWTKLVHPDDRAEVARIGDATRVAGKPFSAEYRMIRRDGRVVWIRESSVLIRDEMGNPEVWQGIMLDVTEQKTAEQALRASERRFRATFDGSAVGTARVDLDGKVLEANRALGDLLLRPPELLVGAQLADFVHPDDGEMVAAQFGSLARGEVDHYEGDRRYLRPDGETIWVHAAVSLVRNEEGAPEFVIVMLEDVTVRKLLEEELSHRALHDPLTGLPNRDLLYDRLGMALARMPRQEASTVVIFLDLDRFKEVNDAYGHAAGDRLLVAVARRLEGSLRPSDTVCRFGGDEFVVLCEDIAGEEGAMAAAWRVRQALARPFVLDEGQVYVEASLGAAVATGARQRPEQLIHNADAAMYRAKQLGGNRVVVFDPSMQGMRGRLEELRETGGT
jgi:diguanylate cyclase (GGDEF)-like protein/PAS domain S-box-containing protein